MSIRVTPGNVSFVNCGKSSIVISPYFAFICWAFGRFARAAVAAAATASGPVALGLSAMGGISGAPGPRPPAPPGAAPPGPAPAPGRAPGPPVPGAPAPAGRARCLNSGRIGQELLAMRSSAAFCAAACACAASRGVRITTAAVTPAPAVRKKSRRIEYAGILLVCVHVVSSPVCGVPTRVRTWTKGLRRPAPLAHGSVAGHYDARRSSVTGVATSSMGRLIPAASKGGSTS